MKKILLLLLLLAGFGFNASAQVVVVEKKIVRPAHRPTLHRVAPPGHVVKKVKHKKHRHPHKVATRTVVVPAPRVVVVKR